MKIFNVANRQIINQGISLLTDNNTIKWCQRSKVMILIDKPFEIDDVRYGNYMVNIEKLKKNIRRKDYDNNLIIVNHDPINSGVIKYSQDNKLHLIVLSSKKYDLSNNNDGVVLDRWFVPLFIGWFWNDEDQLLLHKIAQRCLLQILAIHNVQQQLHDKINVTVLSRYWNEQKSRLHVTAQYFGRKMTAKNEQYMDNVRKEFYKTYDVFVEGFLLTPRTFSGHVVIEQYAQWLFGDADMVDLLPHVTLALSPGNKAVQSGPDQVAVQKRILAKEKCLNSYKIDLGELQDWGNCQFYVKLNKGIQYQVIFSPQF